MVFLNAPDIVVLTPHGRAFEEIIYPIGRPQYSTFYRHLFLSQFDSTVLIYMVCIMLHFL